MIEIGQIMGRITHPRYTKEELECLRKEATPFQEKLYAALHGFPLKSAQSEGPTRMSGTLEQLPQDHTTIPKFSKPERVSLNPDVLTWSGLMENSYEESETYNLNIRLYPLTAVERMVVTGSLGLRGSFMSLEDLSKELGVSMWKAIESGISAAEKLTVLSKASRTNEKDKNIGVNKPLTGMAMIAYSLEKDQ